MPLHAQLDFTPPVHDAFGEDINPKALLDPHGQLRKIERIEPEVVAETQARTQIWQRQPLAVSAHKIHHFR
jgi:hypothetical protein